MVRRQRPPRHYGAKLYAAYYERIVKVRVIGALVIEDEEGLDTKILFVLVNDARFEGYHDITDVRKHRLVEIQEFFETCKRLEPHKWVKVREWKNAEQAGEIIKYAMEKYLKLSEKPPANHK